jgi:hypothetical protein
VTGHEDRGEVVVRAQRGQCRQDREAGEGGREQASVLMDEQGETFHAGTLGVMRRRRSLSSTADQAAESEPLFLAGADSLFAGVDSLLAAGLLSVEEVEVVVEAPERLSVL